MFLNYFINIRKKTKWNLTLPGLATCACSYGKFSHHLWGDQASGINQARSHLGELVHLLYEHIWTFLKEGEPRWASPSNRISSPPYGQPIKLLFLFDKQLTYFSWTYFLQLVSFSNPGKHSKIKGSSMFSRGIEKKPKPKVK